MLSYYRESFAGLPRTVWMLCWVMLVHRSGAMVVPFLGLYLTTQEGFSMSSAGIILASHGIGAALGIAAAGPWVDRLGYRPIILASLVSSGICLILVGQVSGFWPLALLSALVGFTADALRPAMSAAVAQAAPAERRASAFALLRLAINAALTLGPALGGFLARIDYQFLFWVDGCTALAAALLVTRALPAHPRANPSSGPRSPDGEGAESDSSLRAALGDPALRRFLVYSFVMALAFFQVFSTLPLFLERERGFGEAGIGIILALNTLLIVVFEVPLIHSVRGVSPLQVSAVGAVCVGVGFGATAWAVGPVAILLTIAIWTLGEMLVFPVALTWVSNRAHDGNRGSFLSVYALSNAIPGIVAPLAGTWIYENLGGGTLWLACLVAGLVAAVGFWSLRNEA